MNARRALIVTEQIARRILLIRGRKVLLDSDLAELYGVTTKALNQAVKRNPDRFPEDFAFRLSPRELAGMRSQIVTASRRNVRHRPWVFTEHGVVMAANLLHSGSAIRTSVLVVRAFIRLRDVLASHRELAGRLAQLESRLGEHDEAIREIVSAIRNLMDPPAEPRRDRIGFRPHGEARSKWKSDR